MKLSELLTADRVLLHMPESTLGEVLASLARLASVVPEAERAGRLATELAGGAGEVFRLGVETVLVAHQTETVGDLTAALGVAEEPVEVTPEGGASGAVRAFLMLVTPRRVATLRDQIVPALARVFRDERLEARLIAADEPEGVLAIGTLMHVELQEHLLVEDALVELNYRVYPNTPLPEVIDLMVRREIRTVPVVGEQYELLGLITLGDALRHVLPKFRIADDEQPPIGQGPEPTAGEVMTRAVMCVSEDQSLVEAAHILVNRDLEQIPVVREGELIGFVNRELVLRLLTRSGPGPTNE